MMDLEEETEGLVVVSSLENARRRANTFDFVLTIEDPDLVRPLRVSPSKASLQEVLSFHDIDTQIPGWEMPRDEHLASILTVARRSRGRSLLVHCQSGVSRSTAATIAVLTERLGWRDPSKVIALAGACHELGNPGANFLPNLEIVRLADRQLSTGGALGHALAVAEEGSPRVLKLRSAYQRLMRYKASRPTR